MAKKSMPDEPPDQDEKSITAEDTVKLPTVNGVKQRRKKSVALQSTVKMTSSEDRNGNRQGEGSISAVPTMKVSSPQHRNGNRQGPRSSVGPLNKVQPGPFRQPGRPESSGSSGNSFLNDDLDLDKLATIPIMVLQGISQQQGSQQPAMRAEISEAAGSAAYVSVGNIGGTVLKYGSNLVLQRGLPIEGYGLYTLGMSIVTLATAIFNLGLDDAMVRYVAIYRKQQKANMLRGLSIFCTALAGLSGIVGALVVFFYAPVIAAAKHSPEVTPILQMMAPIVPLLCLQTIWTSGLQGFKEFRWRVLLQRILMPIILIVLFIGCILFSPNYNAIIIATVLNTMIGAVFSLFFFWRKMAGFMKPGREVYKLGEWLGFAVPNFLTSIVDTVLESVDTLLLAYFAISNSELALYFAAIKLSAFVVMPQASFNAMFAPTIAELHSQGEHQKLAAMFKVVTKWAITFSLPIFFIITLFSRSLLSIGGERYGAAWPLVIAFAIGTMINVSTGSVGYVLLMTGHQKISFINSLTAVIVNIGVGIILAPRYGAMGVAVATGLAVAVVNVMKLLQVKLLVKMQPYNRAVLKPIGAAIIASAITGALIYLLSLAHLSIQISKFHITFELLLIPVFIAIYFWLLALFKVSPEDKIVLDALSRKFKRGKKKNKKR
ncbi:MAG: flippase [Chloroflexota bacterium]|nr:flippase [Chloroflexota bacterium]